MGHELNHVQFTLPISLVHTLSTAIKKRQQDCIVYRGTIPSPEGAPSSCLFTAILERESGQIRLNIENKAGFNFEKAGKFLNCEPTDLKLLKDAGKSTNKDDASSEKSESSNGDIEIYDDFAEEELDEGESLPIVSRPKSKRQSAAVKNTARKSLRVVLEKLDVKTGKIYEVALSSDEEASQSSLSPSEDDGPTISKPVAIGGRTRTRVIRKPNKWLEDTETPKTVPTRTFPKIAPKITGSASRALTTSTPRRGLQLPPTMSSKKNALLESVQLTPVRKPASSNVPNPTTHPQLFVFGEAQLVEKDGHKQLILPPMPKGATKPPIVLQKPSQVKGPYPTMLIGPGFNKASPNNSGTKASISKTKTSMRKASTSKAIASDRRTRSSSSEIIESLQSMEEEFEEEGDPDWQPEDIDPNQLTPRKRKADDWLENSSRSSKIAKTESGEKTPIGKKFVKDTPNVTKGKLADVVKNRSVNQLPKTPLVTIKPNSNNREVWDDHDYLRQRETTQADAHQTRQKTKRGNFNESKSGVENMKPDKMPDDVDDGLNFQKTFMRQMAIPTVYNINQVFTDYLKMKVKPPCKKSLSQSSVPVELSEVPKIFRQVTFTSKGRPIRIQERKVKNKILAEKAKLERRKKKMSEDGDDDDDDDEDESDGEGDDSMTQNSSVVIENMEDVMSETIPSQIMDDSHTSQSELEMRDITFEESIIEPENLGQLGGCFVPVDENGEPIQFLDENGEPIDLFDSDGNMRELFTENGDPIKLVDESGEAVSAIYQEPPPDYSNYDPNLVVESLETVDDYFDEDDDVDVSVLEIDEDCFDEIPVEEDPIASRNPNQIPCEICFNFFLNYKNLIAHLRSKHKNDKLYNSFLSRSIEKAKVKCEVCDATMETDLKLMEHMQFVHDVDAKYKCKTCGKGFLIATRLTQHENKVHRAIDQLCHLCPAVFKNPRSLEKHIEMHTSGEWDKLEDKKICPHCKRKFDKPASLQAHIKARHLDTKSQTSTISRCWTCQAEFNSAKELRKHMIAEHVLHGHKYHCTLCKKVFDSMDALTTHKSDVHSGGISLHCPFCGIGYMARHTLISHISNNHLNRETPYKCPFCPSKFIRAVFLQKHIGVVHDLVAEVEVRKGSCDDQSEEKGTAKKCIFENCDKTFMREKDVVEHILDSHKEHFPHECETCGQRFAKEKYVTSHSHAAHKTKPLLAQQAMIKHEEEAAKKLVQPPTAPQVTGRLVKKIVATTPSSPLKPLAVSTRSSATNTPITPITANVTVVSKTPDTPVPKKTIILDSSGRQISGFQTHTIAKPPIKVLPSIVRSVQTETKPMSVKHIAVKPAAKPMDTFNRPAATTQAVRMIQQVQQPGPTTVQVQSIQTGQQFPEFIVTSPRTQIIQIPPEQNVDVEQIVYNLNVETEPQAWHYSRIEDHAATLTISQEQTAAVTTTDANSSINVVSAEELWRIINENIDN